MNEQEKIKSISVKTLLAGGAIVLAALLVVTAALVYFFPQNSWAMRVRHILPYPAILVNGSHPIFFRDTDEDVASIRRFYESQSDDLSKAGMRVDFSTPDGQRRLMIREKELLNKMIEDAAVRILAEERHISITEDMVSQTVDQKISALGNNREEVAKQLDRLYGWTISDFEEKIVQPELYKEELSKVYADGIDTSSSAKKKIEDAEHDLKQGESFADTAKKYSEGNTAQDGGELGFIPVSSLTEEVKAASQKQKLNQVTDIIESPLGFHLIVIEERKQEQGQDMIRLKQIFTRKITFADWLTSQMQRMNVTVLFKGYMWDKGTARIEFKQPEMKAFEENLLQKSQGDASVLF
ncbi:MAG: peptidylprolyl isomerase [Candidatus Moranbacteria bacterium]|nr:peptidylprolyl isomerase [Candidatus Moranbacteria bacterium]